MIQGNALLLITCTSYLTESGDSAFTSPSGYHPYLLDDPELTSGRHRKVLNLASYLVCQHLTSCSLHLHMRLFPLQQQRHEQLNQRVQVPLTSKMFFTKI